MTYFGVKLRYLRKQDNITQQQLADALGTAKSTISMYENGLHEPDFETLEKIADYFNVPSGTFFADGHLPAPVRTPPVTSTRLGEITVAFSQLNSEGQEKVIDYAHDLINTGSYSPSAEIKHA